MKFTAPLAMALALGASSVSATPMLDFFIDGDTFTQPFSITNNSDDGEFVTRFQLDLRTSAGVCFDPAGDSTCNGSLGVSFTANSGSDVTTGLTSATVTDEAGGVPAWDFLDITFSDFNAGEVFSWDLDVDFFNSGATIFGDDMIGAIAFVDFSNGVRLIGELQAVAGNSDASAFTVVGQTVVPVPAPAGIAFLGLGLAALGFARKKKA